MQVHFQLANVAWMPHSERFFISKKPMLDFDYFGRKKQFIRIY